MFIGSQHFFRMSSLSGVATFLTYLSSMVWLLSVVNIHGRRAFKLLSVVRVLGFTDILV